MENNSKWKVIKLGGTSQCKTGYDNLIKMINDDKSDTKYIIVLSAVSNVTNLLELYTKTLNENYLTNVENKNIELAKSLSIYEECEEIDTEICSMLNSVLIDSEDVDIYKKSKAIGIGEHLSTYIFYKYFQGLKTPYKIQLLSSYYFVKSKKESFKLYQNLEFEGNINNFLSKYDGSRVVICQGFVASTPSNNTILLGRGGSDTTGAIISNMLNSIEYQVWTDVNGIYSTDPKIINDAPSIDIISYELAQEISSMGAKIMHPYSILPCMVKNIPIIVRNTFNLKGPSTIIGNESKKNSIFFAVQKNITLFKIFSLNMWNAYGFTAHIFRIFERIGVDVNIISTSQFSIDVTTDEKNEFKLKELHAELEESYNTKIIKNRNIISFMNMNVTNYLSKIDYSNIEYNLVHIGSNNMTVNFVVDENKSTDIIKKLYEIMK